MAHDSLFDLQRIWDAWPHIRDHQEMREIFLSASSSESEVEIDRVFVLPGHVFVSCRGGTGKGRLHVFSCSALNESRDAHVSSELAVSGAVVNVIDRSEGDRQEVWTVQVSGDLSVFNFDTITHTWQLTKSLRLTQFPVESCVYHKASQTLVWCEKVGGANGSHDHCYQMVAKKVHPASEGGSISLGLATVFLTLSPPMQLIAFKDGVLLAPTKRGGAYPRGLLLCWTPATASSRDCLGVFVWNGIGGVPPHFLSRVPSRSFSTITLRLASYWSKAAEEPGLVSIAANPLTNQLLALSSTGDLYQLKLKCGWMERDHVTKLSDFTSHYQSPGSVFDASTTATLPPQLFCIHTYYGVCKKGELRVYDSFTGEFVWECDEQEGVGSRFWATPTPPGYCGVHSNSGMWLLRSRKISDHAHFLAHAIFPITTNADETTPGDYLDHGQLLAARLSLLWGLKLLGSKYALEGAYSLGREEGGEGGGRPALAPRIPSELLQYLIDGSLQNPALLVALLAEYPYCSEQLYNCVTQFLERYHSNDSRPATNELLTPLNTEIVPLLEKYCKLARQCKEILSQDHSAQPGFVADTRRKVRDVLTTSETSSVSNKDTTASLRGQLQSLCDAHPAEALEGIRDFLGVQSFKEAVGQLEKEEWQSDRNWKRIFAMETASGLQQPVMRATGSPLSLFEVVCRLLYLHHPDQLLDFLSFAQLARDHQSLGDDSFARKCRKDFFCHRALEAIPEVVTPEATPTSPEAIRVRCQLLLQSGCTNAEMLSLQLLLGHALWSDALSLVQQNRGKGSAESHCALFQQLSSQLARGGVLSLYLNQVWTLRPSNFSIFDFLELLKLASPQGSSSEEPEADSPQVLTVGDIAPKILQLLNSLTLSQ